MTPQWIGKVESYLLRRVREEGFAHISLLDPENFSAQEVRTVAREVEEAGSDAIMVGGSTAADSFMLRDLIDSIKSSSNLPVILFPNNVSSVVPNADAIWFMSLLNSTNPYYIVGAQALAAPLIKKYSIEAIPMAYLIIGEGKAAGFVGDVKPFPRDKPSLVAAFSLAAELLGFRFVYLEAGSGAESPVPTEMVRVVRNTTEKVHLIVGGGIREGSQIAELVKAGAEIIVTGTLIELSGPNKLSLLLKEARSILSLA